MTNASRRLNPLGAHFAVTILFCMTATLAQAKMPDLFGDAPIVEAVSEGSVEKTNEALLGEASVHTRSIDGTPLIVLAVAARSVAVVKLLIDNGARPDDKSKKDETTALTLAAANGDVEIVTYLLDHKADIDEPGALRETALIKAVRLQRIEVVKLLLDRGADREETDAGGATAMEIAERNGSTAIVNLLKKAKPK
jgi:ankyrin repeat protein